MTEEKIIDASKQTDKSQEKFTDERLSNDELEKVAGAGAVHTDPEQVKETGK